MVGGDGWLLPIFAVFEGNIVRDILFKFFLALQFLDFALHISFPEIGLARLLGKKKGPDVYEILWVGLKYF